MKTFKELVTEVLEKGRCHRCGGCVTFCEAINYGALEADGEGAPRFKDPKKCIECGLCYSICPVIDELSVELKSLTAWREPIGAVLDIKTARSQDPMVLAKATDGGVVTALLLHLRGRGHIDGAIVSKKTGVFHRQPFFARTREEILEAAGFHFDTLQGTSLFPRVYSTYSPSVLTLKEVQERKGQVKKVAFVGTPCQIDTMRRMQVLGIVPSDTIRCYFGLFCSGNFTFGEEERRRLEALGNFRWADVRKINIKEDLQIHLTDGQVRRIPLDDLHFMKRPACFLLRRLFSRICRSLLRRFGFRGRLDYRGNPQRMGEVFIPGSLARLHRRAGGRFPVMGRGDSGEDPSLVAAKKRNGEEIGPVGPILRRLTASWGLFTYSEA